MMVYSKYGTLHKKTNARLITLRGLGWLFLILTTTTLLILKFSAWMIANEVLKFKEMKVEGNRLLSDTEVLSLVAVDSSKNIFNIDLSRIKKSVEQHPLINRAEVSRRLPSSIVIEVVENEPIALLNKSTLFPIDENGNIFTKYRLSMLHDYPIISHISEVDDSSAPNNELAIILGFLKEIKEHQFTFYSEISEISYSPKYGVYCYLAQGAIPVFMGENDYRTKGHNLQEVLNILDQEKKWSEIEYLDLRFEGQVVVKNAIQS
ncbi:MAG: cell division protein FtsQ/DivIB [bacterium]